MSWDDYRFNGYRKALEEQRDMWKLVLGLAQNQLCELAAGEAYGRIEAYEAALRLLAVWVKGIQEEEAIR